MTTLRTVDKDNVHIPPADTCVEAALVNVTREAFEQERDLQQEELKVDNWST